MLNALNNVILNLIASFVFALILSKYAPNGHAEENQKKILRIAIIYSTIFFLILNNASPYAIVEIILKLGGAFGIGIMAYIYIYVHIFVKENSVHQKFTRVTTTLRSATSISNDHSEFIRQIASKIYTKLSDITGRLMIQISIVVFLFHAILVALAVKFVVENLSIDSDRLLLIFIMISFLYPMIHLAGFPFRGFAERYYPTWSLKTSLSNKSSLTLVDFSKTDFRINVKILAVILLGYSLFMFALFKDDFMKIEITIFTTLFSAPLILLFGFSCRIARSFFLHLSRSKDLRHARLYILLDIVWIQSYQLLLVALILAPFIPKQSVNEHGLIAWLNLNTSVLGCVFFAGFVAGSFMLFDKLKSNPRDIFYLLFVNNIPPSYPIQILAGVFIFGYIIVLVTLNTRIVNWQLLFFFPLLLNLPIFFYSLLMSYIVTVRPEAIQKLVFDYTEVVFKADFKKSLLFYSATSLGLLAFGVLSIF